MSSTEQAVFDIIGKTCNIERSRISLGAVQVLFEIEDRFNVSVSEREDRYATDWRRHVR